MRKLTELINLFLAGVTALFFVALPLFPPGGAEGLIAGLRTGQWPYLLFLLGAVALAANILHIVLEIQARQHGELTIATGEGSSGLSLRALENQLLTALHDMDDIKDAHLALTARRGDEPVACRLTCKLRRQPDVTGRLDQLKKQVRDAFQSLIPSGPGLEISCYVTDLTDEGGATAPAAAAGRRDEFSGPVYPVDDHEQD